MLFRSAMDTLAKVLGGIMIVVIFGIIIVVRPPMGDALKISFIPCTHLFFETVYPIGFQKIDRERDGTQGPGERVCPEHYIDHRYEMNDDRYVGDSDHAPACHHNEHGYGSASGSAHDAGHAVGVGEKAVEQGDGLCLCNSKGYRQIIVPLWQM